MLLSMAPTPTHKQYSIQRPSVLLKLQSDIPDTRVQHAEPQLTQQRPLKNVQQPQRLLPQQLLERNELQQPLSQLQVLLHQSEQPLPQSQEYYSTLATKLREDLKTHSTIIRQHQSTMRFHSLEMHEKRGMLCLYLYMVLVRYGVVLCLCGVLCL